MMFFRSTKGSLTIFFSQGFIIFLGGHSFLTQCSSLALLSQYIKSRDIWYDLLVSLIGNSPFLNPHISTTGERSTSVFQAQP